MTDRFHGDNGDVYAIVQCDSSAQTGEFMHASSGVLLGLVVAKSTDGRQALVKVRGVVSTTDRKMKIARNKHSKAMR